MLIISCDFHTRFQQIAMLDPTTGEIVERRLEHETGEAEKFYSSLPGPARVAAVVNSSMVGVNRSSSSVRSCRRRLAQGDNENFSNCARPCSPHSFFFHSWPSFMAMACS